VDFTALVVLEGQTSQIAEKYTGVRAKPSAAAVVVDSEGSGLESADKGETELAATARLLGLSIDELSKILTKKDVLVW
jgi:hypothetical protein